MRKIISHRVLISLTVKVVNRSAHNTVIILSGVVSKMYKNTVIYSNNSFIYILTINIQLKHGTLCEYRTFVHVNRVFSPFFIGKRDARPGFLYQI